MVYVGIDIFILKLFRRCVFLIEPFKFSNDYGGFYPLLSNLTPIDRSYIIKRLESTAHYSDNLVRFLIDKDFIVYILTPIMASSFIYA